MTPPGSRQPEHGAAAIRPIPRLAVIVPVHQGARHLARCLDAIARSAAPGTEILVVDDASTDGSGEVAAGRGVALLRRSSNGGPSAARNDGVRASHGEVLVFVDADVAVRPEALPAIRDRFASEPDLAALFGSYDDSPAERNFFSQYKNLVHHFVHQSSAGPISTFWTGCGAVRRPVFESVGGFDERLRCMHDVELGVRIRRRGLRIELDPSIQGTHLKRWTFASLLRSDIFCRAVPWALLMLRDGRIAGELNLKLSQRVSSALVALALLLLPFAAREPRLLLLSACLAAVVLLINRRLYAFLLRRRGVGFAARSFAMQLLYYAYSALAFLACSTLFHLGLRGREPLAGRRPGPLEQR